MRKLTQLFAALFILVTCSVTLRAQPQAEWLHYSNSTTPTCMIEDGPYLWVGSDAGLVRFDRRVDTFTVFYPENSSLPYLYVTCLTRDTRGRIWAGTLNGGIAVYDHGSWSVYNTTNSALTTDVVGGLAADSVGRVWVASNSGLIKFDDNGSTRYSTSNSPLQHDGIYCVGADRSGNVWISTRYTTNETDLFKFDGQSSWESHGSSTDIGYRGEEAHSMLVSRDGSLWIGDEGYLCHLVGRSWTVVEAQPEYNGPAYNYVFALAEDTVGAIWASTGYGAGRWDGANWSTFDRYGKANYPFERCRGIVYDSSEMWFAGYEDGGLARWKDSAWTVFDSLSLSTIGRGFGGITTITAMTHDTKGRYWFGARFHAGLYMFDGTRWSDYSKITRGATVMSLCADSSGNVWIGLGPNDTSGGVIKFDGIQPQYFDLEAVVNNSNVVSALAYDKAGVLWIGTQWHGNTGFPSGVVRYDGSTWKSYSSSDRTLPWGEVNSLAVSDNGDLWAGLWYKGIARFNGNSWTFYDPTNSALPSDQIFGLTVTPAGELWAATLSGGAHFDGSKWIPYTSSNSGILDGLSGVGSDSYGNIWFTTFSTTGGGVCRFDGSSWQTFDPENSKIGARLMESAIRGEDGEMWFGTYDVGVIRYVPGRSPLTGPGRRTLTIACSLKPIEFTVDLTNASSLAYHLRSVDAVDPSIVVTPATPLPIEFAPGETKSIALRIVGTPAMGQPLVLRFDNGSQTAVTDTIDVNVQPVQAVGRIDLVSASDSLRPQFDVSSRTPLAEFQAQTLIIHIRSSNEDVISIDRSSIAISSGFASVSIQGIQPEQSGYAVTVYSGAPIAGLPDQPMLNFTASRFVTAKDSAFLSAEYEIPGLQCAEWNTDSIDATRLAGCGSTIISRFLRQVSILSDASISAHDGEVIATIDATHSATVNYALYDIIGNRVSGGSAAVAKGRSRFAISGRLPSGIYTARFSTDNGEIRSARVSIAK
jgi:ligand-binding sensor domain-containing protein